MDLIDSLGKSFYSELKCIHKTEYFTGFFKSSPKVTIHFNNNDKEPNNAILICSICSFRNSSSNKSCELCGVKFTKNDLIDNSSNDTTSTRCKSCTFNNHPSMEICEICEGPLKSTNYNQKQSENISFMKISFRSGDDSNFYNKLSISLNFKCWLNNDYNDVTTDNKNNMAGINGILKSVDNKSLSTQSDLNQSFKDLNTLFFKADELLKMSHQLSKHLPNNTNDINQFLTSSFNSVSLNQSSLQDDQSTLYNNELRTILNNLFAHNYKSIITLDTLWCAWNRSRGLALISPQILLDTLPLILQSTDISQLKLNNGITILHTPHNSIEQFNKRLMSYYQSNQSSLSVLQISNLEDLNPSMVEELLYLSLLKYTNILKDVNLDGLAMYTLNHFDNYF